MSVQLSVGDPRQDANKDPSGRTTPAHQIYFTTPDFRNKVIEVLSRTANGCLQELGYRPGMTQQITELQTRVSSFQEENRKLYEDNRKLILMLKDMREKQIMAEGVYTGTIHSLERQILSLQKENHDVLVRERSLAAGQPDYARLQADYMRLQGFCLQLKQQVGTLQKMLFETSSLQQSQAAILNQQNMPAVGTAPGSQLIVANLPRQPPAQEGMQKQQHQPRPPGQGGKGPSQQIPSQGMANRQNHPHTAAPNVPGIPAMQNTSGGQSAAGPSNQTLSQPGQILLNKTATSSISRPSSSLSKHPNDAMDVDSQGFKLPGYRPVVYGWTNDPPGATTVTNPHAETNPPRRQVSAPSALMGRLSKAASAPITAPFAHATIANQFVAGLPHHPMARPPFISVPVVNHEINANVVPIGPPGKLLPPLAASVVKPPSPLISSNQPFPVRGHPAPAGSSQPPHGVIDLTHLSPLEPPGPIFVPLSQSQSQIRTQMEVGEILKTPNLTPPSSRSSAAPSEDPPEATTPLDTPISPESGTMAGFPGVVGVAGAGPSFGSDLITSLKRGSMHLSGRVNEGSKPGAEGMRKKPRLSEAQEVSLGPDNSHPAAGSVGGTSALSANSPQMIATTEFMSESNDEDDEAEEEEEIGPDGTRSVKFCLEAFTDDSDDGLPTCLLCLSRFKTGLIEAPAQFPLDMSLDEKVQHFLDEHPTSWEDIRFAKNG